MRLRVGVVGRPFGVRGAITVRVHTDEPERRLRAGNRLWWTEAGSDSAKVSTVRLSQRGAVLELVGVADRNAAEELRGRELWADVDHSRRPAGQSDQWYDGQLVGVACFDPDGAAVGRIVRVEHHPAHDVLVVRDEAGEHLVPFVTALVPEVGTDRVVIADPGGLLGEGP